jgi:signal transduction histidine kinase
LSKELLRKLPLFAGLDEDDLERLYALARRVTLAPGEVLMREGEEANSAYVAIEGSFEITKRAGEREAVIARRGTGEIIGEIALLENGSRSATVRAATKAELLEIGRSTFEELLQKCPGAAVSVLQTITARLRNTELMLRQSEKMAALGTLSAGLAHELNNPAAAVQRSAQQLRVALDELQQRATALGEYALSPSQMDMIAQLRDELPVRLASTNRDVLALGDSEVDLQEWLEELGVDEAWEWAPALAASGWELQELAAVTREFPPGLQAALAGWLAAAVTSYNLLDELGQGAGRIAEIVGAVKTYAYLDRGPVQLLDVHEGLENTLTIMRHRIKQGVEVVREYDRSLPRIEAYGSELNQVWTNIIDNAIDAMQGRGAIRIKTYGVGDGGSNAAIGVDITDNGPGIPTLVQDRIFEAFFTTKEPGRGTGLGLHIAYNIVVNQHRGEISVRSHPGETTFTVKLPARLGKP